MILIEKTLDWEAGLELLDSMGEKGRIEDFLKRMKDDYIERKLYSTAAKIMTKMADFDKKEYVILLVEHAADFRSLKRLFFDNAQESERDIISGVVVPQLDLHFEIFLTNFTKKTQDFHARKARLSTVQQMKEENTFVTVVERKGGKFDNVSEMSYDSKGTSGISVVTGASTMSKKMKKPKNLSKRNVQENSPFEEEYLVEKLNEVKVEEEEIREVGNLCDCLLMFGMVDRCKTLLESVKQYDMVTQV